MTQDSAHLTKGAATSSDDAARETLTYTGSFALDGARADTAARKLNLTLENEQERYRSSYAQGGVYRRDFNSVFFDATTWTLSFAYPIENTDIKLRGALGTAIVNPTMFERFGYVPGQFAGNPNLKPEQSFGREIGADIGFAQGRGARGITLFENDIEDLITGTGVSSANVAGVSERNGLKVSLALEATDWLDLALDYTYTDARSATGAQLARRPCHEIGARATTQTFCGKGSLTTDIRHVAGNFDSEWYNTSWPAIPAVSELPEFTTVNLSATSALSEEVERSGRVVNLFDSEAFKAWGYYGAERAVYVGVNGQW